MQIRSRFHPAGMFALGLLIAPLMPVLAYCEHAAIRIPLCRALAHPAQFDGRLVEFRAKYSGTFEETWLTDEGCKAVGELILPFEHNKAERYGVDDAIVRASKRYGFDDLVRDQAWGHFDLSSRRLYTGLTLPSAGCCDYITADFTGVLVVRRYFRIKNGLGNGWGHLRGSRFLLIMRSVSNVSPLPCLGIPSEVLPPTVIFPQQAPPELLIIK